MNGKTTTFEWPVSHFDLDQIAESGQVFRWERRGPCNYLIPAGDQVCVAYMTTPDKLAIRCPENRAAFWRYYFGLGDPYPEYWQTINTWVERDGPDAYLSRAAAPVGDPGRRNRDPGGQGDPPPGVGGPDRGVLRGKRDPRVLQGQPAGILPGSPGLCFPVGQRGRTRPELESPLYGPI